MREAGDAAEPGDLVDHRLRQVAEDVLGALQERDQIAVRVDLLDERLDLREVDVGVGRGGLLGRRRGGFSPGHRINSTFALPRSSGGRG